MLWLLVLLNVELHGTLNLGSVLRHHGMMGSTVTVIWFNMVFPETPNLIVVSTINSYCKSEAEVVSRVYRLFTKRYKAACKICGKTWSREIVLISPNRPISKKLGLKTPERGVPWGYVLIWSCRPKFDRCFGSISVPPVKFQSDVTIRITNLAVLGHLEIAAQYVLSA